MHLRILFSAVTSALMLLTLSGCFSSVRGDCVATQTECYDRCDTYCDPYWGCWQECYPICSSYCVEYVGSNQCGSNYDCPSGQVCTDYGVCRDGNGGNAGSLCSPCNTDNDCGERGAMCVTFGGASDAFCGRACEGNRDCPSGYSCVNANGSGQCVPSVGECGDGPQGECRTDSECLGDRVCVDNQCVAPTTPQVPCTTSAQCPTGQTCIDAFCRGTCTTNSQCRGDETCVANQCIPAPEPECSVATDCGASGFLCVDSACVARCTDNTTCLAGQTCNGVFCE